mmetsp:Transcript_63850/g.139941  ORF Transcript_63850/g.139941 Transcript_63850/m.139941 type:complete len:360 (+) Transcript_63850:607-1686(+)
MAQRETMFPSPPLLPAPQVYKTPLPRVPLRPQLLGSCMAASDWTWALDAPSARLTWSSWQHGQQRLPIWEEKQKQNLESSLELPRLPLSSPDSQGKSVLDLAPLETWGYACPRESASLTGSLPGAEQPLSPRVGGKMTAASHYWTALAVTESRTGSVLKLPALGVASPLGPHESASPVPVSSGLPALQQELPLWMVHALQAAVLCFDLRSLGSWAQLATLELAVLLGVPAVPPASPQLEAQLRGTLLAMPTVQPLAHRASKRPFATELLARQRTAAVSHGALVGSRVLHPERQHEDEMRWGQQPRASCHADMIRQTIRPVAATSGGYDETENDTGRLSKAPQLLQPFLVASALQIWAGQ